MTMRVLTLCLVPLLLSAPAPARAPAPAASVRGTRLWTYRTPVPGQLLVLRPFEPPPTPYAAGHRGVDLAVTGPGIVLAAGPGRVAFAGTVAGRGVVVIAHPDGVRTEYEPVTPAVHTGQVVAAGAPLGTVAGIHPGCPRACLHWGARRAAAYLDPLTLLRPLGPVRLLPWRGS